MCTFLQVLKESNLWLTALKKNGTQVCTKKKDSLNCAVFVKKHKRVFNDSEREQCGKRLKIRQTKC